MVRVSAGLKEWTRCLLDIADEAADNTDAPTGPKPGGDPMLQVGMTIYGNISKCYYICCLIF